MHDAMSLENRGIPTVVICTEPFVNSANVHSQMFGRPNFKPVHIPHPLGGLDTEQIMQRAATLRDQIVAVLTETE